MLIVQLYRDIDHARERIAVKHRFVYRGIMTLLSVLVDGDIEQHPLLDAIVACHELFQLVKLIRLDSGGKRVVFATDCTLTQAFYPKAVAFAKDCDVLLCDGQYSEEEWEKRSGFGHNTWLTAARLGTDCGAKLVRIVHHDPTHTDDILDAAAAQVRAVNPHCLLAHEGEEIFF